MTDNSLFQTAGRQKSHGTDLFEQIRDLLYNLDLNLDLTLFDLVGNGCVACADVGGPKKTNASKLY